MRPIETAAIIAAPMFSLPPSQPEPASTKKTGSRFGTSAATANRVDRVATASSAHTATIATAKQRHWSVSKRATSPDIIT